VRPVLLKIVEAAGALRARAAARVRAALGVADALLHLFAAELRAVLLRTAAYAVALAALGLVALQIVLPQSLVVAKAPLESEWAEIIRPFPAFALIIPEFNGAAGYASWRHTDGGGRKDVLTFGGQGGATAVVELYRVGAESSPDDGNDITASIAQLRLSSAPHGSPDTIETKFGPVIVETFADRAPDGERGCLKFSRAFEEPHFELSGWFCNAGPEMVDRRTIACALDRLTLFGGRSEPRLGALFARAELKRTFCGANSVFVAATPKRQDWLEGTRDPRLRGRLTEARF
jgi:hypothetical protein